MRDTPAGGDCRLFIYLFIWVQINFRIFFEQSVGKIPHLFFFFSLFFETILFSLYYRRKQSKYRCTSCAKSNVFPSSSSRKNEMGIQRRDESLFPQSPYCRWHSCSLPMLYSFSWANFLCLTCPWEGAKRRTCVFPRVPDDQSQGKRGDAGCVPCNRH